ncbi:MAG: ANTAR domain-containing protein [Eubacteriales bacterium]|nr:ANTAR domain-containing protein [Eubacteriales bacterium]
MGKALLVCAQGRDKLAALLGTAGYRELTVAASAAEARRQPDAFELLVVNAPLPDESGFELCAELARRSSAGVVLLIKRELAPMVDSAAAESGVLLVPKPLALPLLEQALRAAAACHTRLSMFQSENERLQKKLEELRIIDRAKCLLIERMRCTEEEAHRILEKEAMDSRLSRVKVAKKVLERMEL